MAKLGDLTAPMMRRGTSLHADQAFRQRGEEGDELAASDRFVDNYVPRRVDGVDLHHILRQIEPDGGDSFEFADRLAHGRLPCRWGFTTIAILAQPMPEGAPSTPSP